MKTDEQLEELEKKLQRSKEGFIRLPVTTPPLAFAATFGAPQAAKAKPRSRRCGRDGGVEVVTTVIEEVTTTCVLRRAGLRRPRGALRLLEGEAAPTGGDASLPGAEAPPAAAEVLSRGERGHVPPRRSLASGDGRARCPAKVPGSMKDVLG